MDMNSVYQDGPGLRKDTLLYVASPSCRLDQDFRDKAQPAQTAQYCNSFVDASRPGLAYTSQKWRTYYKQKKKKKKKGQRLENNNNLYFI